MRSKRAEVTELGHPYECKQCGKTVLRQSQKGWIRSYCSTTGRTARIWRRPVAEASPAGVRAS